MRGRIAIDSGLWHPAARLRWRLLKNHSRKDAPVGKFRPIVPQSSEFCLIIKHL
jgi:hypothetical protein